MAKLTALQTTIILLLASCSSSDGGTDGGQDGLPGDVGAAETRSGDGPQSVSDGAGTVTPPDPKQLFVPLPPVGAVDVTLHPGSTVAADKPVSVFFGVPFPRDVLQDASKLRVTTTGGAELPSGTKELVRWRQLSGSATSLRAALVVAEVAFPGGKPVPLRVEYGVAPQKTLAAPGDPRTSWVSITKGPFPQEYPAADDVKEPAVYATFSAEWLSACLLRSRTTKAHSDASWKWFDDWFIGGARTAVNDVDPKVKESEKIDYLTAAAPWLFDRAMTLYNVYVRTGDVKWLRHAHRATQFYAKHVDSKGNFDLRSSPDLKYSYGQAMLVDLMLTGDTSLLAKIEKVASAGQGWNAKYTTSTNFWTERHQTYSLLAALSAWEATGKAAHAARVKAVLQSSVDLAKKPADPSWPVDGCLLHSYAAHEGDGTTKPICSPWMSALLADAVWRVYLHAGDKSLGDAALGLLASMAEYVQKHAMYLGAESLNKQVPYYLASSLYKDPEDPWTDLEHACDVAGLVARGAWAKKSLKSSNTQLLAAADNLIKTCTKALDYWHRPNGPSASGRPVWRLSPPRKYNWWFGTTSDIQWLMTTAK
jgi:hypothetical protein